MSSLPSRQFTLGISALAASAIIGLAILVSRKEMKQLFSPIFSWIRIIKSKTLFKPASIIVVNNSQECSNVFKTILRECHELRYVGFDCEWVPNTVKGSPRNPVALLQLATPKGTCILFRICKIGFLPDNIKSVLRDPSIIKVGVSTQSDAKLLGQDHNVPVIGCLDLRMLCDSPSGLATLTKQVLGVNMEKNWKVSCSNWAAETLSQKQITYAANDALSSVLIFSKVTGLHKDYFFKLKRTGKTWQEVATACSTMIDIEPRKKRIQVTGTSEKQESPARNKPISRRFSTVSKPVYDNCMLLAPDGEVLTTCQKGKAEWYLQQGLAEKVESVHENVTLTVKLRFEPKGRSGKDGRNYYANLKQNMCVVCGSEQNHVRKSVVPREYKMFFPENEKDHKSHDILILCLSCNMRLDNVQLTMRRTLAETCNAPIACRQHSPYINDVQLSKVRSAGRALSKSSSQIPDKKRQELQTIVADHFKIAISELSDEHIMEASQINPNLDNPEYQSHGYLVAQHFQNKDGIFELEKMWRSHFVQHMNPKFLPDQWSVTHQQ